MAIPVNPDLVEKVVLGNRILYHLGVLDGFGHISCRLDNSPEHFLLSANRAPGRVTKDDILCLDLNGDIVKTSVLRHFFEEIQPFSALMIEPIQTKLFDITNEYWVSFTLDNYMYDKKYVFVQGSISRENFTTIPFLGKKGVMIR
jgi:hypothetical protein